MIITEPLEGFDNIVHTYSDRNVKIRQVETGIVYDAADDLAPLRYTYEETDEPIDVEEVSDEYDSIREELNGILTDSENEYDEEDTFTINLTAKELKLLQEELNKLK